MTNSLSSVSAIVRPPATKAILKGVALALAMLSLPVRAQTAPVTLVDLGTAADFAILAGSGVTNSGATLIKRNVGSSPTATTAGFSTVILDGTNHGGDPTTVAGKADLSDAYDDAEAREETELYPAIFELNGLTLTSGVYKEPSSPEP